MNPFVNALLAALYILTIVFIISGFVDRETFHGTLFVPIAMISLFTLSAAVMGFLFVFKPLQLYLDNRRHEALLFFAKTVLTFAVLIAAYLAYLFAFAV